MSNFSILPGGISNLPFLAGFGNNAAAPSPGLVDTGTFNSTLQEFLNKPIGGNAGSAVSIFSNPLQIGQQTTAGGAIASLLQGGSIDTLLNTGTVGVFSNSLSGLLGAGASGRLLNSVIQGGSKGQSDLSKALTGMMGGGAGASSVGLLSGLNNGGAIFGLSSKSKLGGILGNVFQGVSKNGILGNMLKNLNSNGKNTFKSSLLSSSQGNASILGGTEKPLRALFRSLH